MTEGLRRNRSCGPSLISYPITFPNNIRPTIRETVPRNEANELNNSFIVSSKSGGWTSNDTISVQLCRLRFPREACLYSPSLIVFDHITVVLCSVQPPVTECLYNILFTSSSEHGAFQNHK